ncbi:MAG: tetratricopeptide repeat protein [bacterium]
MKIVTIHILFFLTFCSIVFAQKDTRIYKRQALVHIQAGRYGEAISLLNKYVTANPRLADGYHLRGQCYEKRKEYQYAVLDYRRALKLDTKNKEIANNLNRAWKDWKVILYDKIEGHKREIARDPKNPFNYLEIGKSFRWLEEWQTAENWYDEYLRRDDNASPDEIIRYTEINSKTRNIVKGERILKIFVERYPTDWRLWSRYGYFTLWLGKNKIAKQAFENALSFKPFFKEAEDGLDLVNNEAYLTQYRPRSYEREYPIDKYYRIIKRNPNDVAARYSLIEELLKENRFEEAGEQLELLTEKEDGKERFVKLKTEVEKIRETYFTSEIEKNYALVKENPENRAAVLVLAQNYASTENYTDAEEILREYLDLKPDDYELRFYYAKYLSYDRQFEEAIAQVNQVLAINSDSTKYHLLAGQLLIWSNVGLDEAKTHIEYVLGKEPNNIIAVISMGTLCFQMENYDCAKEYSAKALQMQPDNLEAQDLKSIIDLYELRVEEEKDLALLIEASRLAQNKECEQALDLYLQYTAKRKPDNSTKLEMADTYVCAERFSEAVALYDEVLNENYDVDLDILRSKVLFWSKDTVRSLEEFSRLNKEYPDNLEIQLYLGDSYVGMHQYDSAKVVFENMLETAPESYFIEKRLSWLPEDPEKPGLWRSIKTLSAYTFSYLLLSPVAYYFTDNLDFEYYYGGFALETSFTSFLHGGISWIRGTFSSDDMKVNYTTLKGNLYITPMQNLLIGFSYGKMQSTYYFNIPTIEATVQYKDEKKKLDLSANYIKSDGAVVLYSPYLVGVRLLAQSLRFDASYEFKSGLKISSYYQLLYAGSSTIQMASGTEFVGDNLGNNFQIRIGRYFTPDVIFGYEYFFSDFKYSRSTTLYYSPQNIDSHSLWGEWTFYKDKEWDAMLGAKLGYVPKSDYILRELFVKASYLVYQRLKINAYGYVGSTIREGDGYNSYAFVINAFWTIL